MEPKQIEGIISLALGAYTLLVSAGIVKVSKNPEANDVFIRKWRVLFILATVFLLARGATYVAKVYW